MFVIYMWHITPVSRGQKKTFHSEPIMWVSYFGLWVAGPHNFSCCAGWVPLPFQKAPIPHFLLYQTNNFSRFTPIFTQKLKFSSFCTMYPNFGSFYASSLFIDPQSLYLSGCLWHISSRQWLRDAPATRSWVPSENLSVRPLRK